MGTLKLNSNSFEKSTVHVQFRPISRPISKPISKPISRPYSRPVHLFLPFSCIFSTHHLTHQKKINQPKTTMELGYWGIQGLAQPARLMLNYQTKGKYTFKDYTSPEQWQADKAAMDSAFPNIPYIKTEEHGTIVQSGAVNRYLGTNLGLSGSDSEKIQAEIVDGVLQDLWMGFIKLMFNKDGYEKEKEA